MAKEIVKNAQPVLKWLEEAEEDSESDEEEIAIAFDNQRSVGTADTKKVASQKVGTNKHGKEEDEIDIDKI